MDLKNRKQEMYTLIEDWQSSGVSRTKYCKDRGMSRSTFRNWLRKYEQDHGPVSSGSPSVPASFVSIEVPSSKEDELTITYPNGVQVSCPSGIDQHQLRELVSLLD